MYLIVTRSFPPEVGGMQNLMWGLTCSIAKYNLVKVFADFNKNFSSQLDEKTFDTIGGLVAKHFASIPKIGERTRIDAFKFSVLHSDKRRLYLLEVERL